MITLSTLTGWLMVCVSTGPLLLAILMLVLVRDSVRKG